MDEEKAYRSLASAIVLQAVNDYRKAILYNDRKMAKDCERFFKSGYCAFLSGVNIDNIAEKLRTETLEFRETAYKIFDEKHKNNDKTTVESAFECPSCCGRVSVRYGSILRGYHNVKGYIATCQSCGLTVKKSEFQFEV